MGHLYLENFGVRSQVISHTLYELDGLISVPFTSGICK